MIANEFKVYTSQKKTITKKEDYSPLFEPQLIGVVGGTGQGKSNLIINLKEAWKAAHPGGYDNIIIYNGSASDSSLEFYKSDSTIFTPVTREKFLRSLTAFENERKKEIEGVPINLRDVYKEQHQCLLILDDVAADGDFLKSDLFLNLITTHRHMMITIVLSVQKYTILPSIFRSNLALLFMYPSSMSKYELESVLKDLPFSKNSLTRAIGSIENKYDFLYFNKPIQSIFKNFDTAIIDSS